jgi:hypothetical protein
MTNDDKSTARGGEGPPISSRRAPVIRTTAPAGTPAHPAEPFLAESGPLGGAAMKGPMMSGPPRAPSPAGHSDRPLNGITPPRTVGGHTARLNVASEAPPDSMPSVPSVHGGTVRMLTPPDLGPPPSAPPQAVSVPIPLGPSVSTKERAPAASVTTGPFPTGAPPAALAGAPPKELAPPSASTKPAPHVAASAGQASASRPADDRSLPIDWLSPMPVAVGIISFALGCMIGLVADMRIARNRPAPVPEAATATAAAPRPAKTAEAAPTAPRASATAHASAAPAATTAAPTKPAPHAPQSPGAVRAAPRPPPPPPPPGAAARPPPRPPPPPVRKPSRPGLPFD